MLVVVEERKEQKGDDVEGGAASVGGEIEFWHLTTSVSVQHFLSAFPSPFVFFCLLVVLRYISSKCHSQVLDSG